MHFKPIYFLGLLILVFGCSKNSNQVIVTPKTLEIKGADVSLLTEVRQSGKVFLNQNNQAEDMLFTLKNAGVNVIRLRLWHNPVEPTSNFETVKNLTHEIHALGLKVMLTVHFSDTWADPGKQTKPVLWQNLSYAILKDSVFAYSQKIALHINPDYIQIGNEINNGFLWPEGNYSNLVQLRELLQQAINGIKLVKPKTKIIMHYAGTENAETFFNSIYDLNYDIIGISYYPIWHGKNLIQIQQFLTNLTTSQNRPIFIAETAYPFTFLWNDNTHNIIGDSTQILSNFSATPAGQAAYLAKIKQLITDIPNGIGFCYWGAEWVSFKESSATNGSSWENQAFWDFNNKVLPILQNYK